MQGLEYLSDHWHGRQGFAWSFWINLVLLKLVILLGHNWLSPAEGTDYSDRRWLVIGTTILCDGLVFVWQVVGVLRASEAHIRVKGSMANVWGAQLGVLIAFWLTATHGFSAWQSTLPVPVEDNFAERMEREHASKYAIELAADRKSIVITGTIELGISKSFAAQLDQHSQVRTIVLNSAGGNIYEARGLSKLIRSRGLNTLVEVLCSSACTTAFIGGHHRSMSKTAQIGFHQYRIDADYTVYNANPEAEQERDRALYAQSKVTAWFLDRMFSSDSSQMWFPTAEELLEAGVVDEISD